MKNESSKVYLVIPTIRNLQFLKDWTDSFSKCHLIIVEDRPGPKVKHKRLNVASVRHFTWKDIDKDLKDNSWIISRKNAGIRCYGFYKAYQAGADVIMTIDDDAYPAEEDFVEKHLKNLSFKKAEGWFPVYPDPEWMYTRGFPYTNRDKLPIMVSHGLWSGALDLDAQVETKLTKTLNKDPYPPMRQVIPSGYFYPMSSMNLAFKSEVTPLMFFPMMGIDPQGNKWGYERFDDIWAGIFSKKIMDHLGMGVVNGSPFVEHRKASRTSVNLEKESSGMKANEILWKRVDEVKLTNDNPKDCYIELAEKVKFSEGRYFQKLKEAMIIWANLF